MAAQLAQALDGVRYVADPSCLVVDVPEGLPQPTAAELLDVNRVRPVL
jgi:hypothetical protein